MALQITRKIQATPLVDIQSEEFAKQYERGVWWSMYGDRQGKGPVADTYLIDNLKVYVEHGRFKSQDDYWLQHIGFYIGMYHGGVLSPSTGQLRPDVMALVAIHNEDTARGYHAGREWYFVETEPYERRFTESQIIEKLCEDATELTEERDSDELWFFCIGCVLGELSGQLFPMNEQERQEWEPLQQEIAQVRRRHQATQEQYTESSRSAILQEA